SRASVPLSCWFTKFLKLLVTLINRMVMPSISLPTGFIIKQFKKNNIIDIVMTGRNDYNYAH
ncbi:hypothetical protein AAULR_14726, partial [Lacticaseibacillus rhamnosus MTCC 5462]